MRRYVVGMTSSPEPEPEPEPESKSGPSQDRRDGADAQPASAPRRSNVSRRNLVVLIAAVLGAGMIGGAVGAFITDRVATETGGQAAPSGDEAHAAGVKLCTDYISINSSMPSPIQTPLQVLSGVNGLRWALADNPDASPEVRDAIRDIVDNYDVLIASYGKVRPAGMDQPPSYDPAAAQEAVDRVLDVCRLSP